MPRRPIGLSKIHTRRAVAPRPVAPRHQIYISWGCAREDSKGRGGGFFLSQSGIGARGYVSSLLPIVCTNRIFFLPLFLRCACHPPPPHPSPPLGMIVQNDDVGLGSSSPLLRARASEYSYILRCVLRLCAARIVPVMWLRHALRSVAQRSGHNLRCIERQ
jgi:hypothetical protein